MTKKSQQSNRCVSLRSKGDIGLKLPENAVNSTHPPRDISLTKEHLCSTCSHMFVSMYNLRRHIQLKHKDINFDAICPAIRPKCARSRTELLNKSHLCPTCSKKFMYKRNLKRHLRFKHKDVEISSLGSVTRKHSQLRKTHVCTACSHTFSGVLGLRHHIQSKHSDVDVDSICPRKVKLNAGSSNAVHACTTCSKTFHSSYNLKRHQQLKHSINPTITKSFVSRMKCPGILKLN